MRTAPLTYFEESPKPLLDSVAEGALLELLEFFIEFVIELLFGILYTWPEPTARFVLDHGLTPRPRAGFRANLAIFGEQRGFCHSFANFCNGLGLLEAMSNRNGLCLVRLHRFSPCAESWHRFLRCRWTAFAVHVSQHRSTGAPSRLQSVSTSSSPPLPNSNGCTFRPAPGGFGRGGFGDGKFGCNPNGSLSIDGLWLTYPHRFIPPLFPFKS